MALVKMVLTSSRDNGEDNVQWTLGIDDWPEPPAVALLQALVESFAAAWTALVTPTQFPAGLSWIYAEIFDAAGGPAREIYVLPAPYDWGTDVTFGPEEVAVCVTELVEGVRGQEARGRIYFGPLAGNVTDVPRPPTALTDDLRAVSVAWHALIEDEGMEPVVISKVLNGVPRVPPIGIPINQYSTDDAWDTQRRRGAEPTTKTFSGLL